ncbi:hypothetical protein HRbin12_00894 [bacterium HR12]|nr:hypothetical protein HRbin12_00894 [bacterium HR12]
MLTTEFRTIATASTTPIPPRSIAARNTRNLAQNPPMGGIPARDTMNTVIATARRGARRARPAKSEMGRARDSRETAVTTAKAPSVITA